MAENRDIVVRDKNGAYKLDMPTLPGNTFINDDGEELNETELEEGDLDFDSSEAKKKKERMALCSVPCSGILLTSGIEFEAALVDMMIRHRNRQSSGEPDGTDAISVLNSFIAG